MTRSIGKNYNWIVKNFKYYENYNKKCQPVKRRDFTKKERNRLIGESTIGATIHIIHQFKPKVWVIENPKTSKTWEFQENHWDFLGKLNSTYYAAYDSNFSLKPTIFKSNVALKLKTIKDVKANNAKHMLYSSYKKRSSIPSLLIKDLLCKIGEQMGSN